MWAYYYTSSDHAKVLTDDECANRQQGSPRTDRARSVATLPKGRSWALHGRLFAFAFPLPELRRPLSPEK